jgi:hypothetical protein
MSTSEHLPAQPPEAPDWDRLEAIGEEQARLEAAGQWDEAAYERLQDEVVKAARGNLVANGSLSFLRPDRPAQTPR